MSLIGIKPLGRVTGYVSCVGCHLWGKLRRLRRDVVCHDTFDGSRTTEPACKPPTIRHSYGGAQLATYSKQTFRRKELFT